MDEKEIAKKLQLLQNIRPQRGWIKATRREILGEDEKWPLAFYFQEIVRHPAFGVGSLLTILAAVAFFGLFHLPIAKDLGQPAVEIAKNNFYDYNYYLEKATKTLAKAQSVDNFDNKEVIRETKEALNKAVKKLPKRPKNPKEVENLVKKIKKIENTLATLGPEGKEVQKATDELKEKTKEIIETEIYRIRVEAELAMLEKRTLTDEQEVLLREAKKDYNNQDYLSALEKILKITNQ